MLHKINEFLSGALKLAVLALVLFMLYWGVRHGWLTQGISLLGK